MLLLRKFHGIQNMGYEIIIIGEVNAGSFPAKLNPGTVAVTVEDKERPRVLRWLSGKCL